jgi:hypothetical protein
MRIGLMLTRRSPITPETASLRMEATMDITAEVLKSTFPKRKSSNPRWVFQGVADLFTALHLLIAADRIEAAERTGILKRT